MIYLLSYGFKFGRPPANFAFDVSYLKNPWREKKLRHGKKKEILKFMREQKEFNAIVNLAVIVISAYSKMFPGEKMVFAFCCSASEYRSPAVVEEVSIKLKEKKVAHKIIKNNNSMI